ncbi:MAG: ABC transporter permease [Candidatus Promineifilaceae bacterium]|nr:ABC transporter permease [Candidatus Promineifilaceae bacterium]
MANVTTATSVGDAALDGHLDPLLKVAAYLSLGSAAIWVFLLLRWSTFNIIDWEPFAFELAMAQWPAAVGYGVYGILLLVDGLVGIGLLRQDRRAVLVGLGRSLVVLALSVAYYLATREFFGAVFVLSIAGMLTVLLLKNTAWALAYPAAFYLLIFFVIPNVIVLVVSMGDRARLGTITYPALDLANLGAFFDDYARFFSRIGGELIYLRILGRSALLALANTLICLLFGYPFAYWIARQPARLRNTFVFLVMIPFWTNFLVRTYAWMLILRDSGVINNFWTITLHEQAMMLAGNSGFFNWLASVTENELPLLFNTPAVLLGLFYGYLPFMILPLYASLDKLDWSLLEAAADLGAGRFQSIVRVLLPLTAPGIAAGSIIVFIPSLGAYVTPDLMGGAKVALVGNLLQQQFMTVRDWPFGSAIGFILMAIMLLAIVIYFRISGEDSAEGLL